MKGLVVRCKTKSSFCLYLAFFLSLCTGVFSRECYIIRAPESFGMFAAANQILGQLAQYESSNELVGLKVFFNQGPYYDPLYGPNWWEYYFEPLEVGLCEDSEIRFLTKKQRHQAIRVRKSLTRRSAAVLVNRYIRVKPFILEKVDQFVSQYFSGIYTIGVHYRGTDKDKEAPRVPYQNMIRAVIQQIPSFVPYQIFVATDDSCFLKIMQQSFPNRVIAIDAERSSGSKSLHHMNTNPYKVGEASILDCLLLSKCDFLIRTSSNLSLWATYFNPDLPVILLNERYKQPFNAERE